MKDFLKRVLISHINATREAYEKHDFELMNIFSNRIMSDAFISENISVGMAGFFLKNASLYFTKAFGNPAMGDLLKQEMDGKVLDTTKRLFDSFLYMPVENNSVKVWWKNYVEFRSSVGILLITDIERKTYKDLQPEITTFTTCKLFKYLVNRKDVLLKKNNNILGGIINETYRTINVVREGVLAILFESIISSMQWIFEYYQNLADFQETELKAPKNIQFILQQIEKVETILSPYFDEQPKELDDELYQKASEIIWENIKEWRRLFIEYLDLPNRQGISLAQAPRKTPELHHEAKEKLTNLMAKKIQEELKIK